MNGDGIISNSMDQQLQHQLSQVVFVSILEMVTLMNLASASAFTTMAFSHVYIYGYDCIWF